MRSFLLCLLVWLNLAAAFAQKSISDQMKWYSKAKPTTNLFVHFDKNVYSNNEPVYFTGYLIEQGLSSINQHNIMAVDFIREADSAVIFHEKFIMENGLSFGNVTIPDSLLTGNYYFLAYTNKVNNDIPELIFKQAITLKTNIDPPFNASMKLLESAKNDIGTQKILVNVASKDNRFLPKPTNIRYRYGDISIDTKTDASGQLLMSLPQSINLTDPNVYLRLSYAKDTSYISMAIPQSKNKASVLFYPEGGNLVNGLRTNIGFEVKDQQKRGIALKAFLYKNNQVIDTIETSSYGIGKFKLLPEKEANYVLKLLHDGLVDSTYALPKAINNGLTINLTEAVVNDTLRVILKNNSDKKINILLHNFREIYVDISFDMQLESRVIKIPLRDVPKGLATLTITDTLGRPLAERIFFAHYNNAELLVITANNKSFKQREKVELNLKLDSSQVNGIVSIAVVQNNRLEMNKMNDIESYSYLKNELTALPINIKGAAIKDKAYMEQILLVKGWRRYNWQELQLIKEKDTIPAIDSLQFTGLVKKSGKNLKSSIHIAALGDKRMNLVQTAENGFFNLNTPEFITEIGKKMYLFPSEKNGSYTFLLNDEFREMGKKLSKSIPNEMPITLSSLSNNTEMVLKSNEKSIRLNEVTITNKKDNSFNYRSGSGANICGDYVCMNNIFNCRNHIYDSGNTQPIVGRSYQGLNSPYLGCVELNKPTDKLFKLNGIHFHKEFYNNDYKDPQEPAFFSTIYWNHATPLNADKETQLSFYTSDITGSFKIIVQGITNKDVIYAEHFFDVKK